MEDVVEINCHGGSLAAQQVLRLLMKQGVRLAEPGEFTKRAFLNGRIDLTQAEAVIDLIRAKSDRAFRLAVKQSNGQLSQEIRHTRHQLLQLIAHLEVNIDYPEHDAPELTNQYIVTECNQVITQITQLLNSSRTGKIIRDGIVTAIVGRPNAGKSSLLNALIKENKAIVTDIPGTTRDVIEEYITMKGVALKLLDTAGIRETDDIVERIGVEKSRQSMQDADLVLLVVSYSEQMQEDDIRIITENVNKPLILIVNKIDLAGAFDAQHFATKLGENHKIVLLSVKENQGFNELEQAIADLFFEGKIETDDSTYVTNMRHIHLLEEAKRSLEDAIDATSVQMPIDIIQIDIRESWELLGQVIGETVGESLLDQIFSQFCLGK
jgi:tRNA modification GTPase